MAKIYLQIDKVKGDAKEKNHKGWISLNSCEWVVVRAGWLPKGKRASKARERQFCDLEVTKEPDIASADLIKLLFNPPAVKDNTKATLDVCNDQNKLIYQYKLEDVTISHFKLETDPQGDSVETVHLSYGKFKYEYKDDKGTGYPAGYDREEDVPI
jgi:type VI secretion system secreted protein Hcp